MDRGEWMYPLRILMVVTSHASLADTGKPTGVWLDELAVPYMRFVDARADVTVTSIMGGKIPVDPRSTPATGPEAAVVERFLADPAMKRTLAHSIPLESVDATRSGRAHRRPRLRREAGGGGPAGLRVHQRRGGSGRSDPRGALPAPGQAHLARREGGDRAELRALRPRRRPAGHGPEPGLGPEGR